MQKCVEVLEAELDLKQAEVMFSLYLLNFVLYIIIITKLVAVIVMLVFIYIVLIPSSPVFLQLMLSWCFALAIDLCLQGKTEESI